MASEQTVQQPTVLRVNGAEHELALDTRATLLDAAARAARPDRRQEGLRPRAVRRVHRAARRPARQRLPRARRRARRRARSRPSRGWPTAARCTRCRRRSSSTTPSSAATAPPASSARRSGCSSEARRAAERGHRGPDRRPALDRRGDPRAHERQPVPLRRLRRTSSRRSRRGGAAMRPFAYERAADAAGGGGRAAPARPARRFLGGGTNLVDLMKLGVETPDAARRRPPAAATTGSRSRPTAGCASAPRVRNSDLAADPLRPRALPGARRRRCSPAPPGSCATWPRSAATCCSARAAPTSRTSPSRATSASRAPAARRARASTATWRSSGTPRRAWRRTRRTWRWRWPRSAPSVHVSARGGDARRSRIAGLHRLPGDEPERDTVLEPGELITAVELPPLPLGRALALPQGARPRVVRLRASVSVAAALDVADGDGARLPHRLRRRRPRAVAGAARRGGAARRARHRGRASRAPPTPSSPQAAAAARQRLQGPAGPQPARRARSRSCARRP